jgi:hypothetical protein
MRHNPATGFPHSAVNVKAAITETRRHPLAAPRNAGFKLHDLGGANFPGTGTGRNRLR